MMGGLLVGMCSGGELRDGLRLVRRGLRWRGLLRSSRGMLRHLGSLLMLLIRFSLLEGKTATDLHLRQLSLPYDRLAL